MLKFNIYITCIAILKYNKKGKLTSIKNNIYIVGMKLFLCRFVLQFGKQ
jgi:hypothetical protein